MNLGFFLQSYNWIFIAPIGLATFFIVMQTLGFGLTMFDGDLDLDADLDADVDVDVDVDVDMDMDVDADLDVDADADADIDAGDAGALIHFLSWFHVGKVPFSVLLSLFFYSFGFAGLFATTWLRQNRNMSSFDTLSLISVPLALVAGALVTKTLGGVIGQLFPSFETKRMNPTRLVGQIAQIDSVTVNHESGRGHVVDSDGDLHTVFLRLASAELPALDKGAKVKLLRYRAAEGVYLCQADGSPAEGSPAEGSPADAEKAPEAKN